MTIASGAVGGSQAGLLGHVLRSVGIGCARSSARRLGDSLPGPLLAYPGEVGQVPGVPESPDVGVDAEGPADLVSAVCRDAQVVEPAHGPDPAQCRVVVLDPEVGRRFRVGHLELVLRAGRVVVEVEFCEAADQPCEPFVVVRASVALADAGQG